MTRQDVITLFSSLLLAGAIGYAQAQEAPSTDEEGGQPQGIIETQDDESEQDASDDEAQADQDADDSEESSVTPTGPGGRVETGPAGDAPDGGEPSPPRTGPDAWMESPDSWATFNGDLRAQKYTPADQITPENVGELEPAWEYHTGDVADGSDEIPMSVWSATPLFVNDTLYLGTPFYRIIALDPGSGEEKWTFDPEAPLEALTQPNMKGRGVAYWEADEPRAGEACEKRVYVGTMDAKLYGVDADTGEPCADFGDGGMVDVNQWNTVNDKWPLSLFQPPTVYNDTLFLGWAGKDWEDAVAPPGTVFALDARTGERKWTFHALPEEVVERTGTANVWASMSLDPESGLLYIPISSPSPNYYGGERTEELPLATSVTALDTETGEVVWSRQLVHHDIWDYDTVAPPTLVDIEKDGETVPALVQPSKQGFLFVLNRETGEPVYPIEEREVPASDAEGEQAAPTQPFVDVPEPVIPDEWPGISKLADIVGLGECSRKAEGLRYEGRFTPPSVEGTLAYPPTTGGSQWGGGAVDPESGVFVINSNSVVQIYRLIPRDEYEQREQSGETGGYYAQGDTAYGFQLETFLNWAGMPCWKPPYGTLAAYDLTTGERLWNEPFGQVQKHGFYMPESWGSVTIGAPVITRSGLIFIGASMDSRVRAIDLESGEVLWKHLVDAPAVSMPAVYTYQGKQYVTFAVGGNSILLPKVSDQVIAFALPD
ncbi:pyrroloquinoline quinone-dependent dehydrogenase [Halomonas sp. MCCC 1A17488]|uniref:pyrroloquinoline quinone-dependent dehydrogenase n=1 Tax=unclassified Halomonas TaxID=2609666 RepID=UPI0018D20381|nr:MULTISPECIES: pyrroloquinoline quinone-dependent dehydrogenase [unclassified Halomonas]MCE8017446.1 pyrroloquinoline quinone-dependent dehydrogenase [Halomonas sp. MCCC 1A17488]MCG3240779.1 pyrroloquinoline quinone-dependent dehydrogenase [Halomonas sp. MCCC 1A17488]QPP49385.1 pyrroloquinoline quinone-dependent dehydrogenase [Halomonas sp. SS10-MC5]